MMTLMKTNFRLRLTRRRRSPFFSLLTTKKKTLVVKTYDLFGHFQLFNMDFSFIISL